MFATVALLLRMCCMETALRKAMHSRLQQPAEESLSPRLIRNRVPTPAPLPPLLAVIVDVDVVEYYRCLDCMLIGVAISENRERLQQSARDATLIGEQPIKFSESDSTKFIHVRQNGTSVRIFRETSV